MDSGSQYNLAALKEIRDSVLILSLGNAYLCEEPFLKKIGNTIDVNLEKLKSDISSLKKRFPGKFADEVDTDEIIKKIQDTAKSLQEPDKEIDEKCTMGELGQELETSVNTLADAIKKIKVQVEGDALTYTKKDSALQAVGGLKEIGISVGGAFTYLFKILICLIILSVLVFSYLFITVEKEGGFLKEIAESEALIQSKKEILSKLDEEKNQISQEIEQIKMKEKKKELNRQDKIDIMDLEMKSDKVDEEIHKVGGEVDLHEKKIMGNREKIEEIKKKSFVERLLRQ